MSINQKLLEGCKSGDRIAQKQLYLKLLPYLRAVANRYLRDSSFIKDALQESFIKIFGKLEYYDPERAPLNKWAAKIVVNVCFNFNKRIIGDEKEEIEDFSNEIICLPQIYSQLSNEYLLLILKKMPQSYYEVFNLNVIDGYSHEEIGVMLQISVALSRKRLSRAREWIKKTLINDQKQSMLDLNVLPSK